MSANSRKAGILATRPASWAIVGVLIPFIVVMAACQPVRTIRQPGRDITLEFNDTALVAPPRSVQDIEGILETIVTRKELSSEKPTYTAADLIDFVEQGRGSAQIKAEALHRFATLDMGVGNYARAITLFGQANARWPHRGDTFRAMISPQTALCYAYAGDLVSAERALKTYPGNRGS
ncbi:MAG: hypothetical protein GY697_27840, partial [Desulfobacterales bacterium]|nr:hypothetical protein [Desulfobacterales bacterium]